ncbi:MAG: 50S ribosomal protein L3 [Gammaproteobacteria bacterium RIFCSPHIGHO2_12_FULL_35_23]|nr:MAG: 50S ribosomal protein L3 [Gammaproteobacteria bacterium RIFCSPHIGHO2_12_FULL_35_23]
MTVGLIGRKCGMTRVFTESGETVPVTVLEVAPNYICQIKTMDNDGYQALQVTTGSRKASRVTKQLAGHFKKAEVMPGRGLWEFAVEENADLSKYQIGQALTVELFTVGQEVDITGTSKGKGFAGTVKRHNFRTQDATHGNSVSHRVPGSIGQNQTPGRVFKGKKMAGHLGDVRVTIQNLEVVKLDLEKNLILIKGAIPGAPGGNVIIKPANKRRGDK